MKDMALSEEKKKDMRSSVLGGSSGDAPRYPHGLKISLDPDQVKELELDDCYVDEKIKLVAEAKIESVSNDSNEQDDKKGKYITIQITAMEIEKGKEKEKGTEETLYGDY